MAYGEFKTEHRITNIMNELNMDDDDVRKIYYTFDKLIILKKNLPNTFIQMNQQTFLLDKEIYVEKMQWINEFMKSKGMQVCIFTDVDDFFTSSEDYDYYYELKTPTQYKKDEEERKEKKKK